MLKIRFSVINSAIFREKIFSIGNLGGVHTPLAHSLRPGLKKFRPALVLSWTMEGPKVPSEGWEAYRLKATYFRQAAIESKEQVTTHVRMADLGDWQCSSYCSCKEKNTRIISEGLLFSKFLKIFNAIRCYQICTKWLLQLHIFMLQLHNSSSTAH